MSKEVPKLEKKHRRLSLQDGGGRNILSPALRKFLDGGESNTREQVRMNAQRFNHSIQFRWNRPRIEHEVSRTADILLRQETTRRRETGHLSLTFKAQTQKGRQENIVEDPRFFLRLRCHSSTAKPLQSSIARSGESFCTASGRIPTPRIIDDSPPRCRPPTRRWHTALMKPSAPGFEHVLPAALLLLRRVYLTEPWFLHSFPGHQICFATFYFLLLSWSLFTTKVKSDWFTFARYIIPKIAVRNLDTPPLYSIGWDVYSISDP